MGTDFSKNFDSKCGWRQCFQDFGEKRKVLDSNPVFNDTLRSLGESLKIFEPRENWTVVLKGTFNS